jgi:hypothetical protein
MVPRRFSLNSFNCINILTDKGSKKGTKALIELNVESAVTSHLKKNFVGIA